MRKLESISIAIAVTLVVSASVAFAQEHGSHGDAQAAVDALASKYMEGWAAGDAAVCASIYAQDADSVDLFGNKFEGRAAIEESIAGTIEQYAGSTIDIVRTSLHMVNDSLFVSDGTWEVKGSAAEGVPTKGFYTVIATQQGGEWLITSGRAKVAPTMPGE